MELSTEDMNNVIKLSSQTDEDYFTNMYLNNEEAETRIGRPPAKHINPLWHYNYVFEDDSEEEIEGILYGVISVLDRERGHKGGAASSTKLLRMFKDWEYIEAASIMRTFGLNKSQAYIYLEAARIAIPFLQRYLHQVGA
jgi:hypothetical protein